MGNYQAFGMLLLAGGIFILGFLAKLWSHTKRDPRWILRGEIGSVIGEHLGPAAVHLVNALLLVLGALLGAGALSAGFLLLRWI